MPNIIEITDFHAPELDPYARLTQNQLRSRLEPEKGIFIAESPKVISRALDAGFMPVSLLMERRQITGPAAEILTRCGDAPVYTADRELLAALTGYELTRGVLCAFQRPKPRTDDEALAREPKLAIVLGTEGDGLSRTTIASCDYTVKIPMSHGVDSLNVAAASAVAFWQLGKQ